MNAATKDTTRPTKKQREMLSFIEQFVSEQGYGPSYREIMRALNYKSVSTVAIHIDNLITRGHLRKTTHSARSLEVTSSSSPAHPVVGNVEHDDTHEQWLVSRVNEHFEAYSNHPSKRKLDELYVLVGALHTLKFEKSYKAARAKLAGLAK